MDEGRFAKLELQVEDIHKALMGNGKPGLLDEWQSHKVEHAKIEGGVNLIRWIVGVVGLPTLASVAWLVMKSFKE